EVVFNCSIFSFELVLDATKAETGTFAVRKYGSNDGLVNEWSAKLPYGTHLFTDSRFDHDNIRKGSAVFSRIEPYLRTAN
ncbi:hypothetical protein ACT453_57850, partial [Bacillus sp. D-CC]